MRRRMLTVVILGIAAAAALILAGWYVLFVHFGRGPAFPFLPIDEVEIDRANTAELAENPLMALTESEAEARAIAEQYGITFVSYDNGVAVYQTDEDPFQVITRGQEKGYPQLSLNFSRTLSGEEEMTQGEQRVMDQLEGEE